MELLRPVYFDQFVCTAHLCQDNCCIGWEIDLDPATANRYQTQTGAFGELLRQSIDWQADPPHFHQNSAGRCAMLNEKNLCRIICHEGPQALCQICQRHPRFFSWQDGVVWAGLGLCCEEAARLLLESELPDRFVRTPAPEKMFSETAECSAQLTGALERLLQTLLSIAAFSGLSISARSLLAIEFAQKAQLCLEQDIASLDRLCQTWSQPDLCLKAAQTFSKPDRFTEQHIFGGLNALFSVWSSTEPLHAGWPKQLARLGRLLTEKDLPERLAAGCPADEAQHLFSYLLFRHLPGLVQDGDLLGRVQFAAVSLFVLRLMAACDLPAKQDRSARIGKYKLWSQEVEYAPGLVDATLDLFCTEPWCEPAFWQTLLTF